MTQKQEAIDGANPAHSEKLSVYRVPDEFMQGPRASEYADRPRLVTCPELPESCAFTLTELSASLPLPRASTRADRAATAERDGSYWCGGVTMPAPFRATSASPTGTKAATGSATKTWPELVETSSRRPTARPALGGFRSACVTSHAGDTRRRCWFGRNAEGLGAARRGSRETPPFRPERAPDRRPGWLPLAEAEHAPCLPFARSMGLPRAHGGSQLDKRGHGGVPAFRAGRSGSCRNRIECLRCALLRAPSLGEKIVF